MRVSVFSKKSMKRIWDNDTLSKSRNPQEMYSDLFQAGYGFSLQIRELFFSIGNKI